MVLCLHMGKENDSECKKGDHVVRGIEGLYGARIDMGVAVAALIEEKAIQYRAELPDEVENEKIAKVIVSEIRDTVNTEKTIEKIVVYLQQQSKKKD